MSASKIQAAESPIVDIFSDEFQFMVPRYQRPYAWTTEQAGEMLDDLVAAASAKPSMEDADPYFLGSIVLVKEEGVPASEVIDGQQRLTTLTILLSALRDRVSVGFAAAIEQRIFQRGDPIKQTVDQPRLRLRERDQSFFESHIQTAGGIAAVPELAVDTLTDSQRNIVENAKLFIKRLAPLSAEQCERLVRFVGSYTYLVVVSTRDFESAYRIFTVLNERGLDLTHTDILKSEIVGKIPEPTQDQYTKTWEAEEEDLGRDDFADLFGHIRMVFAKTKARESILKEFRTSVLSAVPDGRQFIDDVLVPLSDSYEVVTRSDYRAAEGADQVNRMLKWLNRLDNKDWVPPAISYSSRSTVNTRDLHRFLVDLERLAASLLIRRVDVTRRIERYGRLLAAIEGDADLFTEDSPLQLPAQERADTIKRLGEEIYTITRVRLYVLLRLDEVVSAGGANYDYPIITVEHVLPQSPRPESKWRTWFTDEGREYWTHRLANLLLLPRRKNSEASNYEFDEKKEKYFAGPIGVAPFALTTQVLKQRSWTPQFLETRQDELIGALTRLWRLDSPEAP